LQYLLGRLLLAIALAVGLWLVASPFFAPVGVFVGLALPRLAIRFRASRRRKAFEGQLAEGIDLIVGALRAGHGFLQGLESVTREMVGPMRAELAHVLEQVHVGVNPVDALVEMNDRFDSYDLALFTSSVSVHRKVGGNLAEVLENIANTVRERRRIRAEVFALTTGPRVSSFVLCAIPVFLLIAFCLMNGEYRQVMLGTETGHAMIGFAVVWSSIGLFFSRKVAKVEY
jgi:tight adherence protein B